MGLGFNRRFTHLWNEMRRRRVLHATGIYLAGSWVVLQVFDVALVEVGFPEWTMALSVWLVLMGLPLVVLISWRYDFTREGIKRTPPALQSEGMDLSLQRIDYLVIFLGIAFIAGASLSLSRALSTGTDATLVRPADPDSIAVLPFDNLSGRQEDRHLALGLAEDILHRLATIEDLKVASRTAAFELDRHDMDISRIGQRLGVRYLLEGSVRRDGDRLRIVVQMIDTESGYHEWSGSYDRFMADLFAIYDEISGAVAEELHLALAPDSGRLAAPTTNMQAYDYFLQARAMLQTGKQDYLAFLKTQGLKQSDAIAGDLLAQGENLVQTATGAASAENAQRFFARAVETDPEFARAWAGRCQALLNWYWYEPAAEKLEHAETSCRTALSLEPELVEGHVAMGNLLRKTGWLDDALDEYQRALDLDNSHAGAWLGLAEAYAVAHQDDEAERALHRAIELDPDDLRGYYALGAFLFRHGRYADAASVYTHLADHPQAGAGAFTGQGISFFMLGEFQKSAEAYRQVIAIAPTATAYSNVGTQYYYDGRFDEAATMYRQAVAMGPSNPVWWGNLGDALLLTDAGRAAANEAYQRAAELAEQMLQVNPDDAEVLTNLAHYHARLGDDPGAMRYLARAETAAPHDYYVYYYAALAHLQAGRRNEALEAIEQSLQRGYPPVLLGRDPQFAEISGDEAFLRLIGNQIAAERH